MFSQSFIKSFLSKSLCSGTKTRIARSSLASIRATRREYHAVKRIFNSSGLSFIEQRAILQRSIHTSSPFRQDEKPKDDKDKKNEEGEKLGSLLAKAFLWMLTAYMLVATLSLMFPNSNQNEIFRYVSWNEFYHQMLAKGEVEEIIVRPDLEMVTIILSEGAIIKGRKADYNTYHLNIADTSKFESKLREAEASLGIPAGKGVQVVYERGSDTAGKLLASIIIASIILSLFSRARTARNPLSMDRFSQLGRAKFTLIDPIAGGGKGVKFSDVAGLKEVKLEVMEIVDYLKRPERYKELGAKFPKGVLLLGPPGCGKTLLAKAVATEASIPFLNMNGSEFIEMIGGLGAARVRDLFKEGRKRAPCIIYIDEIDAMGRKRPGGGAGGPEMSTGEGEQTLNQLLVEMDGIASTEGVLLLASTNRADVLDQALLRPGRFDRHILIDLPTVQEREEIFEQHMKALRLEGSPADFKKRLAYLTPGFSGADIANVINEAALHAARFLKKQVDKSDLEYAIERVVGGTEKKSHAMTATEKRIVAVHESGHALVGWLTPKADKLLKVTIVPRTNLALGFAQYTPAEQKLYTKEELLAKMRMALGGRVAEAVVFNRITTGAQNDLKKVTDMAYAMVKVFGMDEKNVGLLSFNNQDEGRRVYSKRLAATIDFSARRILAEAYRATETLITENRDKLEKLAEELMIKETLNYQDVEQLIGPPAGGADRLTDPVEFEASLNSIVEQTDSSEPGNKPENKPPPPTSDNVSAL
ncbi:spastic paraplegia 7 [Nesidiocoris tenuis]|uniref:Spastic paraplegia 7 n=1 Tax=Nesidiocoris tenuis TaxID=355587 RepID=A0ABN7A9L1_9HEMI|nr:spastic paraplegia 7 [Nesidiocoris tenuis]